MIATARRDYVFGTVDGEFRDFFECDFEVDGGKKVVEPRSNAMGNIARAVFYMVNEYQLPISDIQLDLLRQWNQQDPPSEDEIRRNELIEAIQGTRNLYIDDPRQANNLMN